MNGFLPCSLNPSYLVVLFGKCTVNAYLKNYSIEDWHKFI